MHFVAFVYTLTLLAATAERVADDWIDPFDMLNYEPSSRGRESAEVRISGSFERLIIQLPLGRVLWLCSGKYKCVSSIVWLAGV